MQALQDAGHTAYGLDIEDNRRVAKDCEFFKVNLDENYIEEYICGQYDYILFGDVLEHLQDPVPALRMAIVALAPGGKVFISVPNAGWIGSALSIINQRFPRDESGHFDKTHLRFYTRETLKDTLLEAGYKHIAFYSKQLPDTPQWPEGAQGLQRFRFENVQIECDRDTYDQLNTYQILAVAWP